MLPILANIDVKRFGVDRRLPVMCIAPQKRRSRCLHPLWLICILCSSALSQIEHGTTVLISRFKHEILVAVDSKSTAFQPPKCKITQCGMVFITNAGDISTPSMKGYHLVEIAVEELCNAEMPIGQRIVSFSERIKRETQIWAITLAAKFPAAYRVTILNRPVINTTFITWFAKDEPYIVIVNTLFDNNGFVVIDSSTTLPSFEPDRSQHFAWGDSSIDFDRLTTLPPDGDFRGTMIALIRQQAELFPGLTAEPIALLSIRADHAEWVNPNKDSPCPDIQPYPPHE